MSEVATIRIVGIEDAPTESGPILPEPFAAEFARLDAAHDCYGGCWDCGYAVGWVLDEESSPSGVLRWFEVWLAVEDDGPVAALCAGCAPAVPVSQFRKSAGGAQ